MQLEALASRPIASYLGEDQVVTQIPFVVGEKQQFFPS